MFHRPHRRRVSVAWRSGVSRDDGLAQGGGAVCRHGGVDGRSGKGVVSIYIPEMGLWRMVVVDSQARAQGNVFGVGHAASDGYGRRTRPRFVFYRCVSRRCLSPCWVASVCMVVVRLIANLS